MVSLCGLEGLGFRVYRCQIQASAPRGQKASADDMGNASLKKAAVKEAFEP